MPSITTTTNSPRFASGQSPTQPARSAASLTHPPIKTTVQFSGDTTTNNPTTPTPPANAESGFTSFLHNTKGVRNVYAGLKGFVKGTFGGPWNKHLWRGTGWFGTLLLFAHWIPGPHYAVLLGYVIIKRAIEGVRQMYTGFKDPDKILKPQPAPEGTD
jgi:hypothetical protein